MPRMMKGSATACAALTALFACFACRRPETAWYSLAVTFGTISYHLLMRLLVGGLYRVAPDALTDCRKSWFRQRPWEPKLYRTLRVKSWKGKMPTYETDSFDPKNHSWAEIVRASFD